MLQQERLSLSMRRQMAQMGKSDSCSSVVRCPSEIKADPSFYRKKGGEHEYFSANPNLSHVAKQSSRI